MSVIGIGVLALPKGIAEGGYAISIFMFLLTCSLSYISVVLLHKSITLPSPKQPLLSYQAIGHAAFGQPGRILVSVVNFLNLFTVCACMLILLGDCLAVFMPSASVFFRISVAAIAVLPLAFLPSLKEIAAVSIIGVVAVFLTCVAVVAFCSHHMVASDAIVIDAWPKRPMAVGISFANFMNSYTVAPVVPTIVASMKHPHLFPKMSLIAFIVVSVVFAVIGFSGYLAYGEGIRGYSSVGDAINKGAAEGDRSVRALNVTVQIGILIVCLSHFVSLFNPVAVAAEGFFIYVRDVPRKVTLAERLVVRTIVVAGCYGLAAGVKNFNSLVNLLGATFVMMLQIIFPFAFYEAITRKHAPEKALGVWVTGAVVGLGLVGMVVGTWEAVASFKI